MSSGVMGDTCPPTVSVVLLEVVYFHVLHSYTLYYLIAGISTRLMIHLSLKRRLGFEFIVDMEVHFFAFRRIVFYSYLFPPS